MKPTEYQSTHILEALACLRVGNYFIEEIIAQWEAIRPPDPLIQTQAEEIAKLKEERQKERTLPPKDLRALAAEIVTGMVKGWAPDPAPTFGDPPAGYTWHNPARLTPEQVGVAAGWRLCCAEETADLPDEAWEHKKWALCHDSSYPYGMSKFTYRTRSPLPDPAPTFPDPPAGWEWHNPENLTPEQVGRGYRLLCKGESADDAEWCGMKNHWRRVTCEDAHEHPLTCLTYRTKDPLPDPKPTAEETGRAAFEAWAKIGGHNPVRWTKENFPHTFDPSLAGDYADVIHDDLYANWLVTRNQTQKP